METITIKMPTWALPYIVNGDRGALSDAEERMIKEFIARNPGVDALYSMEGEEYFTWLPAFGLACTCINWTYVPTERMAPC